MAQSIKKDAFMNDLEVKKANCLRLMEETRAWNEKMNGVRKETVVRVRCRFNPDEL
jgi:hypothetical protein